MSDPENRRLKGFELSPEVCDRLDAEDHGQQRLIVENLLRLRYGLPPEETDKLNTALLTATPLEA